MVSARDCREALTVTVVMVLSATPAIAVGQTESTELPYAQMASRIVTALQPGRGEYAILRYDTHTLAGLAQELARELDVYGVEVEILPFGAVPDFLQKLERADIYVWLPGPAAGNPVDQVEALGRWLDSGQGRQIHFHWGGGTMGLDGVPGQHSAAYDQVYLTALEVDYDELNRAQDDAIVRLRNGEIHVSTPAGTDIRFRVGDRPFNKQNGDASRGIMASARIRIDREIELPAGVVRVAPLEETVSGTIVIPFARFADTNVENLTLEFRRGVITHVTASDGDEAVQAALAATPALNHFREFGLGFNPALETPPGHEWLPYYGYGAGAVRLSLGDNSELGGAVRGGGVRWFFFPDATVRVDGMVVVEDGVLVR